MRVLPFRRFTITSSLEPSLAQERLKDAIGPARASLFGRTREPFMGRIQGNRFDVVRTSHGRNSIRPRIRGTIEQSGHGSVVHGTMKIHELVLGLLAVLALGPGMMLGNFWLSSLSGPGLGPFQLLFPAVVLLGVTLSLVAFASESRRALGLLAEIVEADRSELE